MISRRNMFKYTVAAGTSLFLMGRVDLEGASAEPAARPAGRRSVRYATRVLAQLPGGTLPPGSIPKYATPLLIPPAMPRASRITVNGQAIDYYDTYSARYGAARPRFSGANCPCQV